jgi:hypothetical protein
MVASPIDFVANRTSRCVLLVTSAAGLLAAVAAAPAAPADRDAKASMQGIVQGTNDSAIAGAMKDMRPLGRGPAIRVGRAFDAEDEDCTLAVTRVTDENGHVRTKRGLTCAN